MEQALLGVSDRVLEEAQEGASAREAPTTLKQVEVELKNTLDLLKWWFHWLPL